MRSRFTTAAAVALLSLTLAACGGEDESPGTPTPSSPAVTSAPAPTTPETTGQTSVPAATTSAQPTQIPYPAPGETDEATSSPNPSATADDSGSTSAPDETSQSASPSPSAGELVWTQIGGGIESGCDDATGNLLYRDMKTRAITVVESGCADR